MTIVGQSGRPVAVLLLIAVWVSMAAVPARAGEPEVRIARLQYDGGGDWYCDPSSLPNWLELFRQRTGVRTADTEAVVTLDSEDLYRYPFLYLSGHGRIQLQERELAELRRYLDAGGFLYADDNYGLDASFRDMVAQLYPDAELALLPAGHPMFRAYYDLPGLPKIHRHDGEPAQGLWRNQERPAGDPVHLVLGHRRRPGGSGCPRGPGRSARGRGPHGRQHPDVRPDPTLTPRTKSEPWPWTDTTLWPDSWAACWAAPGGAWPCPARLP